MGPAAHPLSAPLSLTGARVLLTGASSGIGAATARLLAQSSASLTLTARESPRLTALADSLAATTAVSTLPADLTDLDSVTSLAQTLLSRAEPLDVLMLNAGVLAAPEPTGALGLERNFLVNHLSQFLLLSLLTPLLVPGHSRVVLTGSTAGNIGLLDPDDLGWRTRTPDTATAYASSKLCNALVARELPARLPGLTAVCVHPGVVASRGFAVGSGLSSLPWRPPMRWLLRSPTRAAADMVWAASAPVVNGGFLSRRKLTSLSRAGQDPALAAALWENSLDLLTPWLDSD